MRKKKQKRRFRKKKPNLLKATIKWGFVAGLWAFIILGLTVAWYAKDLPDITQSMAFERRPAILVKAADGSLLHRYGDIKGESIAIEDMPSHLIYALMAIEDRRFYQHHGVDPVGIARAMAVNVRHGRFVQGGSTITQQLAKNLFLSRERTIKRKIQEALLALWLEQNLSKDEILSAYLNRVYLGSGAYGIDAAARIYFGKSATDLTLYESATLAGLLKAPSRYSPNANPGLAAKRTRVVLAAMQDAEFINEIDIEEIYKTAPTAQNNGSSGNMARYFTDHVIAQLDDLVGTAEANLVIETTLDPNVQSQAEQALARALLNHGVDRNIEQGAALVLDLDGAVLTMIGGRDYGASEFNRATQAVRAPGSSFKPFVYLTALEQGWKPSDTVIDEPVTHDDYQPKNFKEEYFGEVTLTEALTRSLNSVSVQLMDDVKPRAVIKTARRLGVTSDLEHDLSLALGSSGVSMMDMATAYLTLARGGLKVEPYTITRITDISGEQIYYEHNRKRFAHRVVEPGHVKALTKMMQSVVDNGTGQAAQLPWPVAGKTGTSQDFRDAWFVGFTDQYAGAVWVGNDDNTPMNRVAGGGIPALIWRDMILAAHEDAGTSSSDRKGIIADFEFQRLLGKLMGRESAKSPLSEIEPAAGDDRGPWNLNE